MKYAFPRPPQFRIRTKRSAAGLGLYAEEAIPKRRFIIEYWGKVVTDDEANDIAGRYLFELGNGKTIDGTTRKNLARYINHACKPNCEIEIFGSRVYVFSKRAIKPGEELTYDYGKEYWKEFIKPHGCRCTACSKKSPANG